MYIGRNWIKPLRQEEEKGGEQSGGGGADTVSIEQFNDVKSQLDKVLAKNDELLSEAKKAKAAKREMEQAQIEAQEAQAKEKGDFEQLFNTTQQKLEASQAAFNELSNKVAKERIGNAAMRVAVELADGSNAELLSTFIAPRLKYTDDGVKVLSEAGELTVSTIEDLKAEFQGNARYSALLKGNQSSGGAATGSNGSGATSKILTRQEFDKLPPMKKMEFVKSGGTTTD